MKLSPYISLAVFAVFVIALGVFISLNKPVDAQTLAKQAVDECAGAKDKPSCYEKTVPALFPQYSVSEIFKVVRTVRAMDSSYQFCHVLAHKVGEAAVAADPDKWIDLMSLNPTDGLCSNGFIHGVIGGRFRAEVLDDETIAKLLPQFEMACEP
ncbi:hypothetical protein KW798_01995, partial [Candidatus Parcubacteria bacterium]|nr:hypothetical protein [Candidatus Parcubacteria bacterium]